MVSFRPAEFLGAALVAFAQFLARPRPIFVLVFLGIIAKAKLERIEVKFVRELIHRALEGENTGTFSRSTHRTGRRQI